MPEYQTPQEAQWAGAFGDSYSERNEPTPERAASNLALFAKIVARTQAVGSVLEFGANVGLNLRALRLLLPAARLAAIELNPRAAALLRQLPDVEVHEASILEFVPEKQHDLALIVGVAIHIQPDHLPTVYDRLYEASRRYICLVEYYNPTPVTVPYRGSAELLFKRDFAGELRARHPDLELVDYGFVYRGDRHFPQDDVTWFLLQRGAST